jgi:hypothetical protein
MGKPELLLQHFDEWMIRWKHFQSEDDFKIEKAAQSRRQRNYALTTAVFGSAVAYTAAPATINRIFSAPHFFDFGLDVTIKHTIRDFLNGRRRYTPNGYGRLLAIALPTFTTVCVLEHLSEGKRVKDYKKVESVFGEQFRRYCKNGKMDEYMPINIKAPLPKEEANAIYA